MVSLRRLYQNIITVLIIPYRVRSSFCPSIYRRAGPLSAEDKVYSNDDCRSTCMKLPVCANDNITYANFTKFKEAQKVKKDLKIVQFGECQVPYPKVTLKDFFISVRISKDNEKSKLPFIMHTWFQLAKKQIWFFSDGKNKYLQALTNGKLVHTNCSVHIKKRSNQCCKTSVEFDHFIKSGKEWFCHFNDNNYVNVPRLVEVLRALNQDQDWYLGRRYNDNITTTWVDQISHETKVTYTFWYATFCAGMCINRRLAIKIEPFISNGKFVLFCEKLQCADDITFGYVIEHMAEKAMTIVPEFHSSNEQMKLIPRSAFTDQISFIYSKDNVINIAELSPGDSSRFYALHCHLFPRFDICPKLIV